MNIIANILYDSGAEECKIWFDDYTDYETQFEKFAKKAIEMIRNNYGLQTGKKQLTFLNKDKIQRIILS